MSTDPGAAEYSPPEPTFCKYCGAPLATRGAWLDDITVFWLPCKEVCSCPEAQEAHRAEKEAREQAEVARRRIEENERLIARVKKVVGESGMGERFLRRTFDRYQLTQDNAQAYRVAKAYADRFNDLMPGRGREPGRNGLYISGSKGVGKTHLAAAIANQLLGQGTAVICMTMIDLLERIRRTYRKAAEAGMGISEADVLETYKRVSLLIIDDMGKEPATEWAVSMIYNIINGRYEACLPTIVTSNYGSKQLVRRLTPKDTGDPTTADATVDRLMEMCSGISLTGESWRSR